MPRFSQPRRADVHEDELAAYDAVVERTAAMVGATVPADGELYVGEYWGALLNSPPMAAALNELGRLVRAAGDRSDSFSHYDREFVDQVLWADWKTNVVQEFHLPDALAFGVRLE